MPLSITDHPAHPECVGNQLAVGDINRLVNLTATVLVGLASHVDSILAGALKQPGITSRPQLVAKLRSRLIKKPPETVWQRDGLLFEIICWLAEKMSVGTAEVVMDPHLQSTQQGVDCLKVSFDPTGRVLVKATIYEMKCTDSPRDLFRNDVISSFKEWASGERDDQLAQLVLGLLDRYSLSSAERREIFDHLLTVRPLSFQAALTVVPAQFSTDDCVKLFKGFSAVTLDVKDRIGVTFPTPDLRPWFEDFAQRVFKEIESGNV